jgi:hypothetical protein
VAEKKTDKAARKPQVRNPNLIVYVVVDNTKVGRDALVSVVKTPAKLVDAIEGNADYSYRKFIVEREKKGKAAVDVAAAS